MSILFIDSDIILDIILQRKPFFEASADLLKLIDEQNIECYTSVHAILNVHYLAKKVHGEQLTRFSIQKILDKIKLVPEDDSLIFQALSSNFSDFEDAVQYFAATSAKAEYIITRNTKDYIHSAIPVLTAEQFLNTL